MITIKSPEEIKILKQGGKKLAQILKLIAKKAKPGVTTGELNQLTCELITKAGGVPSFLNYGNPPYPAGLCTSVNEQLVHGIPGNYALKNGDIISLDIGMEYPRDNGLFTDMAITIPVGKVSWEAKKLIKVTREALNIWIKHLKPGVRLNDIAKLVESFIEKNGFGVVRDMVGHGVGFEVHEDPNIPNYYTVRPIIELKEGMVLAFEPMVTAGDFHIRTLKDKWTVVTSDGRLCAHCEHTVAITKRGCIVLTK